MKKWMASHKLVSAIAAVMAVIVAYKLLSPSSQGSAARYIYGVAKQGDIAVAVTGTGQVSAETELDVKSRASAEITSIAVKAGDKVKTGTLLATLDSRDASVALQNAKVSYEKLVKAADPSDLRAAQDDLVKAYNDAWSAISTAFIDAPAVVTGMNDLFYSQGGFLNEASNARRSAAARGYMQSAGYAYDLAKARYSAVLSEYGALSRESATSSLHALLDHTRAMAKTLAEALKDAQNAISYIVQSDQDTSALATSNANSVNGWLSTVNSHLTSLISAENSIAAAKTALRDVEQGADPLDIEAGRLSLLQSEYSYQDYFVKAPFDGTIARVAAKIGDAGNGIILTMIADRKLATISLNEVDVTKIEKGDAAKLTFDAVEGLALQGVVDSVDLIGTVSQGVVTYSVKVRFVSDDPRVKPGMSVSAEIVTDSRSGVLIVPNSAIKSMNGSRFVEIAGGTSTSEGSVRLAKVETGASDDMNTEIISGLREGDRIVVRTVSSGSQAGKQQAPPIFGNVRRPGSGAVRIGG